MVYSIDELREKVTPIAEKYQLRAVYVFGSYARNEATDDSDVDVLVDKTGSTIINLFDRAALFDDLNTILSKNIDLVTTSGLEHDDVKKRTPWFTESVMRDRGLVYEQ